MLSTETFLKGVVETAEDDVVVATVAIEDDDLERSLQKIQLYIETRNGFRVPDRLCREVKAYKVFQDRLI